MSDWFDRLQELVAGAHTTTGDPLDAGAQLVVKDPDGAEVFRAPLARHARRDEEFPDVVWVRPVLGGYRDPDTGNVRFALSLARRRALDVAHAELIEPRIRLGLLSGQVATVEPAAGAQLDQLTSWDQFTLLELTGEELDDLADLRADSWYGRYA